LFGVRYDLLPGGPADLAVIADDDGTVLAAGFRDPARIAQYAGIEGLMQPSQLGHVRRAWADYLAGDLAALDRVPVAQHGSPIQELVWRELRHIRAATTLSYSQVAALIGRPRAARAVGGACGANKIAPFIPCHRVVAADGGLGGYGYGLGIKRWLLLHEQRCAAA
jgi:methylated-DNA-[protein]-cysteine S-methyltransferase